MPRKTDGPGYVCPGCQRDAAGHCHPYWEPTVKCEHCGTPLDRLARTDLVRTDTDEEQKPLQKRLQ